MEEQDQPTVSVKELLARLGKDESDLAAGGRSRRRRGGDNSVSVGDLTGEIPVVREGPSRTHRAETAGRKWTGWPKRDDPDAHLDDRDREWDFRVLSGEIERVREPAPVDYDDPPPVGVEDKVHEADLPVELDLPEQDPYEEEPGPDAARNGVQPKPADMFSVGPQPVQPLPVESRPVESQPVESQPFELIDEGERDSATSPASWIDPDELVEPMPEDEEALTPDRVSAFEADQLERARAVRNELVTLHSSGSKPSAGIRVLAALRAKGRSVGVPAWLLLVGQFAVGFLVGVVLFWVFRQLWIKSEAFAAVLAVVTVATLVLGVRWIRHKNDWVSMAVAAFVGIWVCFGPWAILLLGR